MFATQCNPETNTPRLLRHCHGLGNHMEAIARHCGETGPRGLAKIRKDMWPTYWSYNSLLSRSIGGLRTP